MRPVGPAVVIAPRRPLSINAANRAKFKAELARIAHNSVEGPFTSSQLYCKVWYFYRGPSDVDADNMSKPVLDALEGIVYENDRQVVIRVAAKVSIDVGSYEIAPPVDALDAFDRFTEFLAVEHHVLYIEIGEIDTLRLAVGVVP